MKKNFLYLIVAVSVLGIGCTQSNKSQTQEEKKLTLIKQALQKLSKKPKKNDTIIELVSQNIEDDVIVFDAKKQKRQIIKVLILQDMIAQSIRKDSLSSDSEKFALVALATNEYTYKTVFGESWLTTMEKPYKGE